MKSTRRRSPYRCGGESYRSDSYHMALKYEDRYDLNRNRNMPPPPPLIRQNAIGVSELYDYIKHGGRPPTNRQLLEQFERVQQQIEDNEIHRFTEERRRRYAEMIDRYQRLQ
jgi:hypothetical protein